MPFMCKVFCFKSENIVRIFQGYINDNEQIIIYINVNDPQYLKLDLTEKLIF